MRLKIINIFCEDYVNHRYIQNFDFGIWDNFVDNTVNSENYINNAILVAGEVDYDYDEIGELVLEGDMVSDIVWNMLGKVQSLRNVVVGVAESVEFGYDVFGNCVMKRVVDADCVVTGETYLFTIKVEKAFLICYLLIEKIGGGKK